MTLDIFREMVSFVMEVAMLLLFILRTSPELIAAVHPVSVTSWALIANETAIGAAALILSAPVGG